MAVISTFLAPRTKCRDNFSTDQGWGWLFWDDSSVHDTYCTLYFSIYLLQKVTLVLGLEVGVTLLYGIHFRHDTCPLQERSNGQYINKCHEHVTVNFYFTKSWLLVTWPVGCNFLIPEWNCSIEKAPFTYKKSTWIKFDCDLSFGLDTASIWTYTMQWLKGKWGWTTMFMGNLQRLTILEE